jgi:hypothetical protein
MSARSHKPRLLAAVFTATALTIASIAGQTPAKPAADTARRTTAGPTTPSAKAARTPWGAPDLQGVWTSDDARSVHGNGIGIVQNPDCVAIIYEMIHETRLISLSSQSHLAPRVRQYISDSRGRWEGDALVIDTTNFRSSRGPSSLPASTS